MCSLVSANTPVGHDDLGPVVPDRGGGTAGIQPAPAAQRLRVAGPEVAVRLHRLLDIPPASRIPGRLVVPHQHHLPGHHRPPARIAGPVRAAHLLRRTRTGQIDTSESARARSAARLVTGGPKGAADGGEPRCARLGTSWATGIVW